MIRSSALLLPSMLDILGNCACANESPAGSAAKFLVQLNGSIVDSSCSIRVGDDSQAVEFKPLSLNKFSKGNST